MLAPCTCKHEFQDMKYGPGMRVMNRTARTTASPEGGKRCTVCDKDAVVTAKKSKDTTEAPKKKKK